MLTLSIIYTKHNEAGVFPSKNTSTKALNTKEYKWLGGEKYGLTFFLAKFIHTSRTQC